VSEHSDLPDRKIGAGSYRNENGVWVRVSFDPPVSLDEARRILNTTKVERQEDMIDGRYPPVD